MINDNDHESGGAQIVPAARRGIHQYLKNSQLKPHEKMGRIGLTDDDNLGFDEIDNIQSKFSRHQHILPELLTPPRILRQNSTDTSSLLSSDSDTNEENKRVHSKSLPTYLQHSPNSSNFRNEFKKNTSNSSVETTPAIGYYDVTESSSTSWNHRNNEIRNHNNEYQTPLKIKEQKSNNYGFLLAILMCLIAVVLYWKFAHNPQTDNVNYDVFKFYNDMDNLRNKYPISMDSILQVQTGISTIYEQEDTGSFVFLYNSNIENFKTEKLDRLLHEISLMAAQFLRNDTLPVKHLEIAGSDLHMSSHGELINQYREDVSRAGVMLVKDVDNVPSGLAMAFHYYCDEYNPLVRRSAIFFTLDEANCNDKSVFKSTHAKIEKCLTKKWSSVPEDNIKPLLTRVVSVVIDLTNIF